MKMKKKIYSCLLAGVMMSAGTFALSGCSTYEGMFYVSKYDVSISCDIREGTTEEFLAQNPVVTATFINKTNKTLRYREGRIGAYSLGFVLIGTDGESRYNWSTEEDESRIATVAEGGYATASALYLDFEEVESGETITLQYELDFSDGWYRDLDEPPVLDYLIDASFSLGADGAYLNYFSGTTDGADDESDSEDGITPGGVIGYGIESVSLPTGYYSLGFYFNQTAYANFFHITESTETTNN